MAFDGQKAPSSPPAAFQEKAQEDISVPAPRPNAPRKSAGSREGTLAQPLCAWGLVNPFTVCAAVVDGRYPLASPPFFVQNSLEGF
jgi:hypothetical protein